MKTTLIKTDNSLILVSGEEIKEGDVLPYCITWANGKCEIFNSNNGISYSRATSKNFKPQKVLSQSPKLSKEVADEIVWIDVEEGLWQQFRRENPNTVGGFKEQYESFKWCFQKVQELNQKKYTEDIIIICKNALHKAELQHNKDYTGIWTNILLYLKSLSQPQQWQVEAEEIDGVWNVTKILK